MKKITIILAFVCAAGMFFGCKSTEKSAKPVAQQEKSSPVKEVSEEEEALTATVWNRGDFTVSIQPEVSAKTMDIRFVCSNRTSRTLWIPKFYVTFTERVQGKEVMTNNWLTIINQKDSQSLYRGKFKDSSSVADLWKKSNCVVLKPGASYSFTVKDVQNHYYISEDTTMLTVQYQGPLGDSNKTSVSF